MKNTQRLYHSRLTLASGVPVANTINFPLNRLYNAIWLRIKATVTVGGGTPASYVSATNPILQLVKNIQFKVSGDGNIAVNAPGVALYHLAAMKLGKLPRIDNASFNPNSKAAYAMSVSIPLLFADPRMARPEDTCLDMSRYSSAELSILMGDGTDVVAPGVGSDGTFTVSAMTADIVIDGPTGYPRESLRPIFFQKVELEGSPKNTASDVMVHLMKAPSRLLKRVLIGSNTYGTISKPFSGVASSAIIDTLSFGDDKEYYDRQRYDEDILDENQTMYQVDAQTGIYLLDYVKGKSNLDSIPTGDKGDVKLEYTIDANAPATGTNIVSTVSETLYEMEQFAK